MIAPAIALGLFLGIVGTWAVMRVRVAEARCMAPGRAIIDASAAIEQSRELHEAHARCADALSSCQRRLEAIRTLSNKPDTIRKRDLRDILDGGAK